jgi:hypothetical protein
LITPVASSKTGTARAATDAGERFQMNKIKAPARINAVTARTLTHGLAVDAPFCGGGGLARTSGQTVKP